MFCIGMVYRSVLLCPAASCPLRTNELYLPDDGEVWRLFSMGATVVGQLRAPDAWDPRPPRTKAFDSFTEAIPELRRAGPSFMDAADVAFAWDESRAEAARGWLEGPFSLDEIEELFGTDTPVVRRFVVHQGGKRRLCDDGRRVNALSVLDRRIPLPSALDALGAATGLYEVVNGREVPVFLRYSRSRSSVSAVGLGSSGVSQSPAAPASLPVAPAQSVFPASSPVDSGESSSDSESLPLGRGAWAGASPSRLDAVKLGGFTVDIQHAYKLIPVQPAHRKWNIVAVFEPSADSWSCFISRTMLFGMLPGFRNL